jgi:hypothetical protein
MVIKALSFWSKRLNSLLSLSLIDRGLEVRSRDLVDGM